MNHQRDGKMRHRITKGNVNYWPNRMEAVPPVPPAQGGYLEYPQKVEGIKQRVRGPKFQEHYSQASLFYNSLSPPEKTHLQKAMCFELSHCDDPIVYESYMKVLINVDMDLAKNVAIQVNGTLPSEATHKNHGRTSRLLSQLDLAPIKPTIKSRRIAILVADGFNAAEVQTARALFTAAGAVCYVIGPRRAEIQSKQSQAGSGLGLTTVVADHHFEGQRSTMFDALYIPGGLDHVEALSKNGRVIHWLREAFGHLKPIGATGEAVALLRNAVALPGVKLFEPTAAGSAAVVSDYGVVTASDAGAAPHDDTNMAELLFGEYRSSFLGSFAHEIGQHRCYAREADGLVDMVAY